MIRSGRYHGAHGVTETITERPVEGLRVGLRDAVLSAVPFEAERYFTPGIGKLNVTLDRSAGFFR